MKLFANAFKSLLAKENVAGPGGAFGSGESAGSFSMGHGGAMTPVGDPFATNDTRIPKGGKKGKKTDFKPCDHCKQESKCKAAGECLLSKEKKHDGSIDTLIPMQKRPFQ